MKNSDNGYEINIRTKCCGYKCCDFCQQSYEENSINLELINNDISANRGFIADLHICFHCLCGLRTYVEQKIDEYNTDLLDRLKEEKYE